MKASKLYFTLIISFFSISSSFAQLELKAGPLGLLFDSPDISIEYIANKDFGLQSTLGVDYGDFDNSATGESRIGASLNLNGKYYFKPKVAADGFYAGIYSGVEYIKTETSIRGFNSVIARVPDSGYVFSAGMNIGYKWLGKRNLLFEMAVGAGRSFGEAADRLLNAGQIDGMWMIAIGYRFDGKKER